MTPTNELINSDETIRPITKEDLIELSYFLQFLDDNNNIFDTSMETVSELIDEYQVDAIVEGADEELVKK